MGKWVFGLRFKFNLIVLLVFSAGFLTVGVVANRYLERQAIDDAERAALLALDVTAIGHVDTRVAGALGSRIVEMRLREFPFDEVQSGVEGDAAMRLKSNASNQVSGIFLTTTGERKLVVARRVYVSGGNGLVRTVTINLHPVLATVSIALTTLLSSLGTVFFAVFFALNLMMDRMIIRPIAEMAQQADAVSIGDFSIPEFEPASKDEIGVLGLAFNRMRRSTEEAIKLLKV